MPVGSFQWGRLEGKPIGGYFWQDVGFPMGVLPGLRNFQLARLGRWGHRRELLARGGLSNGGRVLPGKGAFSRSVWRGNPSMGAWCFQPVRPDRRGLRRELLARGAFLSGWLIPVGSFQQVRLKRKPTGRGFPLVWCSFFQKLRGKLKRGGGISWEFGYTTEWRFCFVLSAFYKRGCHEHIICLSL